MKHWAQSISESLWILIRYWLPVIAILVTIFYFSSLPPNDVLLWDFRHADKVAHALIYGCLGFSLCRALTFRWRDRLPWKDYKRAIFISIFLATLYGISDEWHQSFNPGREVEGLDLVADFVGAAIGSWLTAPYRMAVIWVERNVLRKWSTPEERSERKRMHKNS